MIIIKSHGKTETVVSFTGFDIFNPNGTGPVLREARMDR